MNVGGLDHSLPVGPALVDDSRVVRVDELKLLDLRVEAVVQTAGLCLGKHRLARGVLRLLRALLKPHQNGSRPAHELHPARVQLAEPAAGLEELSFVQHAARNLSP